MDYLVAPTFKTRPLLKHFLQQRPNSSLTAGSSVSLKDVPKLGLRGLPRYELSVTPLLEVGDACHQNEQDQIEE